MEKTREKSEKMRRCLCFLLTGIILLSAMTRIFCINTRYSKAKIVSIPKNQEAALSKSLEMRVNASEWMGKEELMDLYGKGLELSEQYDYRGIIVTVTVKNISEKKKKFHAYQVYLENESYSNGLDMDLYLLQGDGQAGVVTLRKGEEKQIRLAYTISSRQFTGREWGKINDMVFFLVKERYPIKKMWEI